MDWPENESEVRRKTALSDPPKRTGDGVPLPRRGKSPSIFKDVWRVESTTGKGENSKFKF
jgi:hypothetical protein